VGEQLIRAADQSDMASRAHPVKRKGGEGDTQKHTRRRNPGRRSKRSPIKQAFPPSSADRSLAKVTSGMKYDAVDAVVNHR
jgi:hypothetical protein